MKRTIVVTGAAGNLGRAVVRRLAGDGERIVAVDREMGPLEDLVATLGGEHLTLAGVDLMSADACEAMVKTSLDRFGRVDAIVHTVGGFTMGNIEDADASKFELMFRLNVLTTLNVFRSCTPALKKAGGGAMVAIGAAAGEKAGVGMAAYAGSKAAVHRLVESFADELKTSAIRVNAVLPSIIDTPQNRTAMAQADHSTWVSPENLAATIAFLLSEQGRDITGALIPVNGRF